MEQWKCPVLNWTDQKMRRKWLKHENYNNSVQDAKGCKDADVHFLEMDSFLGEVAV